MGIDAHHRVLCRVEPVAAIEYVGSDLDFLWHVPTIRAVSQITEQRGIETGPAQDAAGEDLPDLGADHFVVRNCGQIRSRSHAAATQ